MDSRRIRAIVTRFRASFLATFPALTTQDLHMIVTGPSETLLDRLQVRYGYTRTEAKAAWNDFVLAHVDGHGETCPPTGAEAAVSAGWWLDLRLWRLMCLGWGRLSTAQPSAWLGRHHPGPKH